MHKRSNAARRACDRCYRYKEKCHFEDDTKSCALCRRSGASCTTSRPHPRQGRRPKVKRLGPERSVQVWDSRSSSSSTSTNAEGTAPTTPEIEGLTDKCSSNLQPCSSLDRYYKLRSVEGLLESSPWLVGLFYSTYDLFMLGPTFAPRFRAAIQVSYMCSPVLLQDIGTVIFTTVKRAKCDPDVSDQSDESDCAQGAIALQKLRTARVGGIEDALAMIVLGQTLAAFEIIRAGCLGSSLILRHSLASSQPWYAELARHPSFDPITITPIFWDTVFCLIRREIPATKFCPRDFQDVDRTAGMCTTLLPIFYDLCVASNRLKECGQDAAAQSLADTKLIRRLEQRLLSWAPVEIPDLSGTFSNHEIMAMKAQASMYRQAGLLIAHRMLNSIGTQDDLARSYANNIILELSSCRAMAKPQRLHHVAFPILMAALELPDIPQDIWERIAFLAVAPVCLAKMQAFVAFVWRERRRGFKGCIFDLVDCGPKFDVVP